MPSRRTSNPAEWRTEPYRFAKPGDKYLLWVEGMDGGYAGLCAGEEIDPAPATLVRDVTTAFWDAHLKGDAQARQRLHFLVRLLTSIEASPARTSPIISVSISDCPGPPTS